MNKTLIINKNDNVAVALKDIKQGETYNGVTLLQDIPCGHKFALKDIKENENIIKYGYPIGHAKEDIKQGSHVHVSNTKTNLSGELNYSYNPNFIEETFKDENILVNVYKRKFNKYGIRNNLIIVPLVGCVNSKAEQIKQEVLKQIDSSKIDDIIVVKHPYGCSQMGDDMVNTVATLQAIVKHPNAGGVLVFALGCENNQIETFKETLTNYDTDRVMFLKSQDVEDEVAEGVKLCMSLYNKMIKDTRELVPISNITIGLKCGGSDGFSGISANPLVGMMSDFIVANGGSTLLSEVPEMFGAEQVLMERAKDEETFNKIVES